MLTETYVEPSAIKSLSQNFLALTNESCSRLSAFFMETYFQFHVGLRTLSGTTQPARKLLGFQIHFQTFLVINPVFQWWLFIFRELNHCI